MEDWKTAGGSWRDSLFFSSAVKSRVWHFENKSLALAVKQSVTITWFQWWLETEGTRMLTDLCKDTWLDWFTANGERKERGKSHYIIDWLVGVMSTSMSSVAERWLMKNNCLYVGKYLTFDFHCRRRKQLFIGWCSEVCHKLFPWQFFAE